MFDHLCCLCPLGLAFKLNFNISKGKVLDKRNSLYNCLVKVDIFVGYFIHLNVFLLVGATCLSVPIHYCHVLPSENKYFAYVLTYILAGISQDRIFLLVS